MVDWASATDKASEALGPGDEQVSSRVADS